jgi:hypothetical protein
MRSVTAQSFDILFTPQCPVPKGSSEQNRSAYINRRLIRVGKTRIGTVLRRPKSVVGMVLTCKERRRYYSLFETELV